MTDVSLRVRGQVITGWTSVEIVDSLEALAPTFSLSYSDQALAEDGALRIELGDECHVRIGDEMVLTGYVDDFDLEETATSRSLSVKGRSRTEDIVDCSVPKKPSEWRGKTVAQIAEDLCTPLAILVFASGPVGAPLPHFAAEPGEKVFECLSRAARQRGLMLQSTTSGDLAIVEVGERIAPAALRRGENILSARRSGSLADRFAEIRVVSQLDDGGLFSDAGRKASATARDEEVRSCRRLTILGEQAQSSAFLRERAAWEVSSRAGKAGRVSVTVRGWGTEKGLWRSNSLCRITHAWLGLDDVLLIASVRYSLDDGGTLSTLELCRLGAFKPEPLPAKKPGAKWP